MTITNSHIKELLEKYKSIWALNYVMGVSYRDMETYMPESAIDMRGEAHAQLTILVQRFYTDPEIQKLVSAANESKALSDAEKGIIRVMQRGIDMYMKLPESFVSEWTALTTTATEAWKNARNTNDFVLFQPYLQKIVDMCLQKSDILGGYEHPYDAHLDSYEEGLKTSEVIAYFENLKQGLLAIKDRINPIYKTDSGLSLLQYDKDKLASMNMKVLKYLGFDDKRQRLDIAVHPFSMGLTNQDLRITTRYEKEFQNTISSTIHEFGHSLYDREYADELNGTPIAGGSSLIIHESQSRFRENIVGKSMSFIRIFHKDIAGLGEGFEGYTDEQFYQYINHVQPNLIRVDADELYYHYHVLIRFEIEKGLMEKTITVDELPRVRNQKYKEYLDIDVPTDTLGVLQDCHWSNGLFGYFPTYSMGTALSVMWKDKLEADIGSIDNLISEDGIAKIRSWLKEHVHQYASTYTLTDLLKKNDMVFSEKPLLTYLEKKFCI